jgi:c-di-GMP-binding flagellar brake protein YcgR
VWVNAGTASYTTTYTQYETLAGSTGTVNGSITIGRKPTLLKGAPALASLVSTTSYRINAGGGALSTSLGSFAADNFFAPAPGNTYSTSAAIGGTSNTALYQTERFGSNFGYSLPITNGQYSVKLHFAEIYYTTAGSRVFDVSLESQKVLDNFDIVARAGAFTANSQSFTVSVTDGVLNINFSSLAYDGGKDHAKVSAIEVVPAGTTSYRINAGGGALSTSLGSFAADNFFAPAPGNTYSTSAAIGGTSNTALYQTERFGSNFGYSLPITNGQYSVKLHFAEIYYTTAGSRVFDVSLESQKVLDNFDIVARAGAFTANSQSFTVSVTDGVLNINFSSLAYDGGKDHAKVSAIEVVPAATAGATSSQTASNSAALMRSAGTIVSEPTVATSLAAETYPNPSRGQFNLRILGNSEDAITMRIFDLSGKMMESKTGISANSSLQFGGNLVPGVYIVEIIQGKQRVQKKITKL